MGKFALAYADQAERDHAALKAAVRAGLSKRSSSTKRPAGAQAWRRIGE